MSLITELKRRNVFRAAAFYAASAWLLVQVATQVFPFFHVAEWVVRWIVIAAVIGFPFAMGLSWFYEWTPHGIQRESEVEQDESITRETGKKMDRWIIAIMALAIVLLLADILVPHKDEKPTAASSIPDKSIAVLPFLNLSADPNQEYFSDGIAEELLNRLAQFSDLKVAARTSAFQFKGKNLDIGDIGRRLKVTHVLEGSVRKAGVRLRITAQLIDSNSGYHMWSETYDRDASDVFKVQDEIAGAIAVALEAKLGGPRTASTPARTANPAAFDDYLQGRTFLAKRRIENLDKAIAAFDRAIAQDPGYSAAYSGRAFAAVLRPVWGATDLELIRK